MHHRHAVSLKSASRRALPMRAKGWLAGAKMTLKGSVIAEWR